MKLFSCRCGNVVHFENDRCVVCGAALGFAPDEARMLAYDSQPPDGYRLCQNGLEHHACNWLVAAADDVPFCRACRLNETIPDLSVPENQSAWAKIEHAKRRLIYTLLSWNLPITTKTADPDNGLAFAFLREAPDGPRVLTGHADGLITLNIAEADDPFRESTRQELGETYRTLLGHFRHESGHYYWDRLIYDDPKRLAAFRDLFGDETREYGDALDTHYAGGGGAGWENDFVSAYAAAHPWEDWAETWAHYMHMWDTMETAAALGLSLAPRVPVPGNGESAKAPARRGTRKTGTEKIEPKVRPRQTFEEFRAAWPALTMAINGLNRAMGLRDAYPFAPSEHVARKLRFVHDLVRDQMNQASPVAPG